MHTDAHNSYINQHNDFDSFLFTLLPSYLDEVQFIGQDYPVWIGLSYRNALDCGFYWVCFYMPNSGTTIYLSRLNY